jgi:hypothetical protein
MIALTDYTQGPSIGDYNDKDGAIESRNDARAGAKEVRALGFGSSLKDVGSISEFNDNEERDKGDIDMDMANQNVNNQQHNQALEDDLSPPTNLDYPPLFHPRITDHLDPSLSPKDSQVIKLLLKREKQTDYRKLEHSSPLRGLDGTTPTCSRH